MPFQLRTFAFALGTAALMLSPLGTPFHQIGPDPAFAQGGNGGGNGGGKGGGNGGGGGEKAGGGPNKGGSGASSNGSGGGKSKATVETASADPKVVVKPGKGSIASELKGLNAYHASAQAMANADPESQVGRIAAYRTAAGAAAGAAETITGLSADVEGARLLEDAAREELAGVEPYTGRSIAEIDADIALLDPQSPTHQDDLQALTAERQVALDYDARIAGLTTAVAEAEAERMALEQALAEAEALAEGSQRAEAEALLAATGGRELSPEALAYFREQLGL